jgi:NAD(P)-dependent dehydrogenase (short-subunit alcohol dehydrogenase family)
VKAHEQTVKAFVAGLGLFDHLVFTAGETLQIGRLADIDISSARGFFDLRFWGAYMAAKYAGGSIRPRGSIFLPPASRVCAGVDG